MLKKKIFFLKSVKIPLDSWRVGNEIHSWVNSRRTATDIFVLFPSNMASSKCNSKYKRAPSTEHRNASSKMLKNTELLDFYIFRGGQASRSLPILPRLWKKSGYGRDDFGSMNGTLFINTCIAFLLWILISVKTVQFSAFHWSNSKGYPEFE